MFPNKIRKISPKKESLQDSLATQDSKEASLASVILGQSKAYGAATTLGRSSIHLLMKGQKHKKYCSNNCHSCMLLKSPPAIVQEV